MRHILLIDSLEKLVVKKDSSLLLATTLQARGDEVYLLFEEDLNLVNHREKLHSKVYAFVGHFNPETYYIERFELGESRLLEWGKEDLIHMRFDPPFDTRYLRYLWILRTIQQNYGVKVLNNPEGILKHNEKLVAYFDSKPSLPSFVGTGEEAMQEFTREFPKQEHWILKPLDLYQGLGIQKVTTQQILQVFKGMVRELKGPVVVQPFIEQVMDGEIRSVFAGGKMIGSILKTPPKGDFLANIARGASYVNIELKSAVKSECERVANELKRDGIELIAFDILADCISEVNVTCPGLLVEVSHACKRNLADEFLNLI